jgi:hypothetical protein
MQNKIIRFEYIKTKILKAYHKKIKGLNMKMIHANIGSF